MTHVTCRLTAKSRDQPRNPTLGNRLWATFLPVSWTTIVGLTKYIFRGLVPPAAMRPNKWSFVFLFVSILGMNLFGGKFCSLKTNSHRLCNCSEVMAGLCECSRKNFDSLLWAIVTVFQVCAITSNTEPFLIEGGSQ